jgi:phosphonate transport system substrate-binding protein
MRVLIGIIIMISIAYSNNTLKFAPLPMENTVQTLKIFSPMVKYLEKNLGKKIEIIYKASNKNIVDAIINKEIDIAYLGPLPYVDLKKRYNNSVPIVQFLNKNGTETYTCTLFVREEEKEKLTNTKNYKFALTQKYSTCGYAFAQEVLLEKNLSMENNSFKYIGAHYDTIIEVLSGSYDIGGAKTSIFNKYKYLGVKAIAQSLQNPGFMLVANGSTVSNSDIKKIRDLMINTTDQQRKNWGSKIKNKAILPNIKLFDQYEKRVRDIKLKDEK